MKQYLQLIEDVINKGHVRKDRTGTGTISIFGTQSRYDLSEGFPLCTTKKVNFKPIVEELLWMLRGETNINTLNAKIWDKWAQPDGELGPIYGFSWRHWGSYQESLPGGSGKKGIDQIQQAIDLIKTNPESRRIIVTAWNPDDLPHMALSPCHMIFQFYVRTVVDDDSGYLNETRFLDCQMYQRSADLALGVPFNIASYALLTTIIAKECDLQPGEFVHTIGDCHIYLNHVEGMKEQFLRSPMALPKLGITSGPAMEDLTFEHFTLRDYNPQAAIKFEISV